MRLLFHKPDSHIHTVHIILRVDSPRYPGTGKNIFNLADCPYIIILLLKSVKQIIIRRQYRIITPVGCSYIVTVMSGKRPCNYSGHLILSGENLSCFSAHVVQAVKRKAVNIDRNLKNTVSRCIYNRLAGTFMFCTEFLNYLCS